MTQIDWANDYYPARRAPAIDLVRLTTWMAVAAVCGGFWYSVISAIF